MTLEDSNGTITEPTSVAEVTALVARVGNGIDHCILEDGDLFIQAAGSPTDMVVQYGDGTNLYEASQTLSRAVAEELFTAFFNRDPSWKTKVSFVAADGGVPPSGADRPGVQSFSMAGSRNRARSGGTGSGGVGRPGEGDLKSDIMNSVTGEIRHGITGIVRRLIRNVFRNFR